MYCPFYLGLHVRQQRSAVADSIVADVERNRNSDLVPLILPNLACGLVAETRTR